MSRASDHRAPLEELGLAGEAAERLARYLDTLARWGRSVNLSGASSPGERVAVLVAPALPALAWMAGESLLDVGSGNGSPGLVLALLQPGRLCTLLEPRTRRWAFLREAVRATGATGVSVLRLRHTAYRGNPADTVTVRALRLPLADYGNLVRPGGRLLAFGEPPAGDGPFLREGGAPCGLHVFRRQKPDRPACST